MDDNMIIEIHKRYNHMSMLFHEGCYSKSFPMKTISDLWGSISDYVFDNYIIKDDGEYIRREEKNAN